MRANDHVDVLYIDLDSYFASVEQQDDPRLHRMPVAVVPSADISSTATCIAASYEAKALGIRTGTRVGEARERCPDIALRPARHDRYVEVHGAVKSALERVLPVEKVWSIDEFACLLKGSQRRLPEAVALARAARYGIHREAGARLGVSIGLAANTLLAKIAAEMNKPDGLQWIAPGQERERLAPLPLLALPGINRRMEARLRAAGVADVTALFALPYRHARMIWGGVQGERFLRALHGETIPDPEARRRMIGHSQILVPAARAPEEARAVARRLLVKAAARLRRLDRFATRMTLSVRYPGDGRVRRETGFTAMQDTLSLLRILSRLWSDLPEAGRLRSVAIMLHGLVSRHEHTPDLFGSHPGQGNTASLAALSILVDGLNRRYGRDVLTYGPRPAHLAPYTGAKIAFGRVPEGIEFNE